MEVHWLEPWGPVERGEVRSGLEAELRRELGTGHALLGMSVTVVAQSRMRDDVLFALDDGRVAEVHLTWRGRTEIDARWPVARIYPSIDEWTEDRMKPDHYEYSLGDRQ